MLNKSGNVGKTTIANYLLSPRMGADILRVQFETTNSTGGMDADIKQRAEKFRYFIEATILLDTNTVVVVGASNFDSIFQKLKEIEGWPAILL